MQNRLRLSISEESKEYKVVNGIVDLGYMGVYKPENIEVKFDEDSLETVFNNSGSEFYHEYYRPLKPYLKQDMTNDEIAKGLTDFYNARIADIKNTKPS